MALAMGFLLVSTGELSAQACDDVSGVWSVALSMGGGQSMVTVTLDQEDCVVAGTVVGRTTTDIEDGTVDGADVSFVAVGEDGATGQSVSVRWAGTVEGDDISGLLHVPGGFEIPFSGTRAESLSLE
jgi:hypothetical protein